MNTPALECSEWLDSYKPDRGIPWNATSACHFLRRTGFHPGRERIKEALEQGFEKTVSREIVSGSAKLREQNARTGYRFAAGGEIQNLKAWWIHKLVHAQHPFAARMTLFWHNHFATSNSKVKNPRFMLEQHLLLEEWGLGSFRDLLMRITKDPAMLIWLDGQDNRKGSPNENFARELFELFSLGVGNYTEIDIKEAARALTGYRQRLGVVEFKARRHDGGKKTVFGHTGNFGAEDIVELCLAHEAGTRYVPGKLFKEFVGFPPTPEVATELAEIFRASNFNILTLIKRIVRSRIFFSKEARRIRVKSPVEFLVGTVRAFEGRINGLAAAKSLQAMGQDLLEPPSVAGWEGGRSWINSTTLLARYSVMNQWTSKTQEPQRLAAEDICSRYDLQSSEDSIRFVMDLLLDGNVPSLEEAIRRELAVLENPVDAMRTAAFLVSSSPEHQMG